MPNEDFEIGTGVQWAKAPAHYNMTEANAVIEYLKDKPQFTKHVLAKQPKRIAKSSASSAAHSASVRLLDVAGDDDAAEDAASSAAAAEDAASIAAAAEDAASSAAAAEAAEDAASSAAAAGAAEDAGHHAASSAAAAGAAPGDATSSAAVSGKKRKPSARTGDGAGARMRAKKRAVDE